MTIKSLYTRFREGFTLVELTVVVLIIGVLAAFGIPMLLRSVERCKASEAFNYLAAVRASQERYQVLNGTHTKNLKSLDIKLPRPKYFKVKRLKKGYSGSLEDSWKLKLQRKGASAGFGKYTVEFTQNGYNPAKSSIENYPEIIPIAD